MSRRTPLPAWVLTRRSALGHRIAALRGAAGMSRDQLAELAGLERRSIQRYEGAVRDPRYSDLLLISRALNVTVAQLTEEE
ncbi:helix-turn-helix transcriptional regulator [Streptomyces atratus]|uniref:helix-turn-helix domain-containing protein n=1 Tax=Streptomyces atratus TaxID=1893 RepID=UPI00167116AC|nr:helix-turn-helix transcriptional regulator [Streptomyces atratus]WPW27528.1 helix-turn-helix transcriptional regulator [Streptomyces atratus]